MNKAPMVLVGGFMLTRVFVVVALLALSGVCASAGVVTLGTFTVNPQSTFLFESSNDVNAGALFIDLTCPQGVTTNCVNAPAGSTIQIIGLGTTCFDAGACMAATLGGVFDANNTLLNSSSLPPGNVNRLTGTVNAGAPRDLVDHNQFLNTYFGNVDTTIANDFYIPTGNGLTLVVPANAQFLVIGTLDSYYADNVDPSHTLGVQINQIVSGPQGGNPGNDPNPTPEPATLGLFVSGIAGLAALKRYRSR